MCVSEMDTARARFAWLTTPNRHRASLEVWSFLMLRCEPHSHRCSTGIWEVRRGPESAR